MCAGNELFYSMLYLLYFVDGPPGEYIGLEDFMILTQKMIKSLILDMIKHKFEGLNLPTTLTPFLS